MKMFKYHIDEKTRAARMFIQWKKCEEREIERREAKRGDRMIGKKSQETTSSIRHVIIIMMGQAILHSSWWLSTRRMKGSNFLNSLPFPYIICHPPLSSSSSISPSYSIFWISFCWMSEAWRVRENCSCSFHKLFIYAASSLRSPPSNSSSSIVSSCNIENIDRILWDYLCFSISWLTMCHNSNVDFISGWRWAPTRRGK